VWLSFSSCPARRGMPWPQSLPAELAQTTVEIETGLANPV
jgi:hypothetical protein